MGELLDLDECAGELVAAGYERVDQVEDRGQFAVRGGLLDVFPATEDRAVRVDLFDVEIESLRWFSTFTQRSLGEAQRGRDRAGGRAGGPSDRELARDRGAARRREAARPDIAELLPVERFRALLELVAGRRGACWSPPRRSSAPALADHWQDVMRGVRRRGRPPPLRAAPTSVQSALERAPRIWLSAI